jgi:Fe-S-cluster containining protein
MRKINIPVTIEFGDAAIDATARVPDVQMRPADLLPILFGFTDAMAALAIEGARREGRTVSCRAGCGACCRQVVPIAECEALYLAELVDAMPPERQARVRQRFRDALVALGEPLVETLRDTAALKDIEKRRALHTRYFGRQVPCPFLEDESCSIHEHRPTACREYLVSSPPENCRTPGPLTLRMISLPVKPSQILYCFGDGIGNETTRWVPLVLALDWAEARRAEPQPVYDGPQMFRNFIAQVARWLKQRETRGLN